MGQSPNHEKRSGIEFWFAIGSTYTYLSVMRLPQVERASGIPFHWRPFNVREIMVEQQNVPFSTKPVKRAYMWRDVERRAGMHGLPFKGQPPYPLKDLARVNRIAALAANEGWVAEYAQAAYRCWFSGHLDPSSDEGIRRVAGDLGKDVQLIMDAASRDISKQELDRLTQRARELGLFGSPTWVTKNELFWGDDRLEDALAWHKHGTLSKA